MNALSSQTARTHTRTAALLIALLFFSLAFQGSRGLWDPDEGRYTDVALEMISLDDWIEPHLHWETHHWTKPPLTYWAIAGSLQAFGRTEFAARLASALAFFGTIVLAGLLGRIFLDRQHWLAAPMYAATLLPFIASNLVTTDTVLAFWECLGVYAFARATWHPQCHRPQRWLLLMWGAFGAAFLTKGPPGLLPLLAIAAYTLATPRLRRAKGLNAWRGLLVFLAVALPWYLVVVARNPGLLSYFVGEEIVARVASEGFQRHAEWYGGFEVYVPTLLVGTLPWAAWWLRAAWRGLAAWRRRGRDAWRALDERQRFLLWWLLLPLLVFFIARSRLPLYLLPLMAPLVLLSARELLRRPAFPSRRAIALLAVWMVLLVVLRGAAAWVDSPKDARAVAGQLRAQGIERCEEIAFYGMDPMLGLRFYLDCEVEHIPHGALTDELAERERRFWIVRHTAGGEFEARMAAAGRRAERIGELPQRWLLYLERRALPAATPDPPG